MKLPNTHLAMIERGKICDYVLNSDHRFGASKARFFSEFGFRVETWEVLADALRGNGQQHKVSKVKETGFGLRYEVDGEVQAPDGRRPRVRTVWQIDEGQIMPRLITVYPLEAIMIKEHDCVVLTQDLLDESLQAGDVGTVVHLHRDGAAYEVEFVTLTGQTFSVATVLASQLRPVSQWDISHVRQVQTA